MARPKEFDRQTALHDAMQVFWRHGFEATTMTDLRKAMGIGRQSLYDTFGDKQQLFAEALDMYVGINKRDVNTRLEGATSLRDIRAFLESRAHALSSGARRGCLVMNTCVELAPHDETVAKQIEEVLEYNRAAFASVLEKAKAKSELEKDTQVDDLATFLTNQLAGMSVMAKNGASEQQLRTVVDHAMRAV